MLSNPKHILEQKETGKLFPVYLLSDNRYLVRLATVSIIAQDWSDVDTLRRKLRAKIV